MKARHTIGIVGALFTVAGTGRAQVLNTNVGIPLDGNFSNATVYITFEYGIVGQANLISDLFLTNGITKTYAGDLILVNPTGGTAPANWAADIRFFNPLDPTGTQGLAATETQGFFPANAGAGGFAGFALLPNYNFVTVQSSSSNVVTGNEGVFGPIGAIGSGEVLIITFSAFSVPAAVPEPSSTALLIGMGVSGSVFLVRRRSARKAV